MNAWLVNPTWQNFSSLFREAVTAQSAKTGMERSHHLTASLYFGISALEAFLNHKMRARLKDTKTEQEVYEVLRRPKVLDKVKKWPEQILGKAIGLPPEVMALVNLFNEIRGDLTHPKTQGEEIYRRLESVDPQSVIDVVAEYIVRYHETEGSLYPYWLFGWNYLNPRQDAYEIFVVNEQQFCFSLQALGVNIAASDPTKMAPWQAHYLGTFQGYLNLKQVMAGFGQCQPKRDRFPYMPVLCRRWWLAEHHTSCGNVTKAAIDIAKGF